MKKIIALALSTFLMASLAACGASSTSSSSATSGTSSIALQSEAAASVSSVTSAAFSAKEGLFDVDITISAEMINALFADSGQSMEEYLATATKTEGIKNAVLNPDGSVTITMTKEMYEQSLAKMKAGLDESIKTILETEGTSIKSITYNNDVTEITITLADKTTYQTNMTDSISIYSFSFQGAAYRCYSGSGPQKVTINLVDESTGETFESYQYPQE